jgi:hypothetical protein
MSLTRKISNLFRNKNAQADYIKLLRDSHAESLRDGKLTMDVGTSRERDLIAVLCKYFGRDCINWNIPSDFSEDVLIENKPVSIKHLTTTLRNNCNTLPSFKIKWTSNADAAERHIEEYIKSEWTDYLIVSEIDNKGVTVNVISPSQVNRVIKFLKRRAFKEISRKNNIRGIEFSEITLNLLKNCCKSVRFKADVFSRLLDPIDKRLYKLT